MTLREKLVENIIKEYTLIYNLTVDQQQAILERVPNLSDRELMDEMRHIVQYYSSVKQAYQASFTTNLLDKEQMQHAEEKKNLSQENPLDSLSLPS